MTYLPSQMRPFLLMLALGLATLVFWGCKKDPESVQLLLDPSLNPPPNSGQTFPDGWFYWKNNNEHRVVWEAKQTGSQDYYLVIANQTLDTVSYSYFIQTIQSSIPKGKQLVLKAKIKADNMTGLGAVISVRCDGPQGKLAFADSEATTKVAGTFDWKPVTVVLDKVPEETTLIYVFLLYLTHTTGKVYFDDVTLTYQK